MTNIEILKRLLKDYTIKYLNKIILAVFFSILVAGSTSATAWLLDPAIEKIFINSIGFYYQRNFTLYGKIFDD